MKMKSILLILILSFGLTACGGYSERTSLMRNAMQFNQPKTALKAVKTQLKDQKDRWLLDLEQGTILQVLGQYKDSVKNLEDVDEKMEILDYTSSAPSQIAKHIFADDSGDYRPFPHEKILVNLLNQLNHLYLGELSEAKVEAKRVGINLDYFKDKKYPINKDFEIFCSLINAFTFTLAGQINEASPYLNSLPDDLREKVSKVDQDDPHLLIISRRGQIPYKVPKNIPIGMAMYYVKQSNLSADEKQKYDRVYVSNTSMMVRYPDLFVPNVSADLIPIQIQPNGPVIRPIFTVNLKQQMINAFEYVKDEIIVAAMSRVVTRALVGGVSRGLGKSSNQRGIGLLGLAGSIAEGVMLATDVPDTRSWTTLPAYMDVYLFPVKHEKYQIFWHNTFEQRAKIIDMTKRQWYAYFLNKFKDKKKKKYKNRNITKK
jgi:hypothetical protein